MTTDDFIRHASSTRLSPYVLRMARRILVDGLSAAQAAREAGRARQEASRAAKIVLMAAENSRACSKCGRPCE